MCYARHWFPEFSHASVLERVLLMDSFLYYSIIFSSKSLRYSNSDRVRIADLGRWTPLAWPPTFQSLCCVQWPLLPSFWSLYQWAGGGWVTYSKTWLWSLALYTLVSQGFKQQRLFKVTASLSGGGHKVRTSLHCVVEAGGGKEGAFNTTHHTPHRAPLSWATSPSLASPWFVWWLFPEQSMPQHTETVMIYPKCM